MDQTINVSTFHRLVSLPVAYDLHFFSNDSKYRLQKLFEQILELLLIYRHHMYESSIMFPLEIINCFIISNFLLPFTKMNNNHKKLLMFRTFVASKIISNRSPGEVVSLSVTNGLIGNPSVAIMVKL